MPVIIIFSAPLPPLPVSPVKAKLHGCAILPFLGSFQHVSVYTVFVCIYVICEQTIMCVITVNADVIFCGFVNKRGGGGGIKVIWWLVTIRYVDKI